MDFEYVGYYTIPHPSLSTSQSRRDNHRAYAEYSADNAMAAINEGSIIAGIGHTIKTLRNQRSQIVNPLRDFTMNTNSILLQISRIRHIRV